VSIENEAPDDTYDHYLLEVNDLSEETKMFLISYIKEQENTGYDWAGILFSSILKLRWESDRKWYCSEIVTKLLQILGSPEANRSSTLISPGELYKILSKKLKKI